MVWKKNNGLPFLFLKNILGTAQENMWLGFLGYGICIAAIGGSRNTEALDVKMEGGGPSILFKLMTFPINPLLY